MRKVGRRPRRPVRSTQDHLQGLEEGLSGAGELGGEVEQVGGLAAAVEPFLEGVQAELVADGAAEAQGVGDAALGGVKADGLLGVGDGDLDAAQAEGGPVEVLPGDGAGGGGGAVAAGDRDVEGGGVSIRSWWANAEVRQMVASARRVAASIQSRSAAGAWAGR